MIILKDGTYYEIDDDYAIFLQQSFPDVDDVYREFLAMAAWADANPDKRKTRRGMKRFITGWLNKASKEKRGISPLAAKIPLQQVRGKMGMKSWSFADDITHDFMKSESYRAYCLEKYGQYVTFEGERVTA